MRNYQNKEWLNQKYWIENKSIREIADDTKRGIYTIYYWLCKSGIKRRTQSELSKTRTGKLNACWKGGRVKNSQGYILIRDSTRQIYEFEHRLVIEKSIGRKLEVWEIVHHKNANRTDNRLENLEIVTRKTHLGKIICPYCQKSFSMK